MWCDAENKAVVDPEVEISTEASLRAQKRKNQENLAERKPKCHSPSPASVHFERENLPQEYKIWKTVKGEWIISNNSI